MNLLDGDLFETWRLILGLVCGVYATVVTARSVWGWVVYFAAPDRYTSVLRTYAIVQLLRLRWRRFWWEFLQVAFWVTALALLMYGHRRWA